MKGLYPATVVGLACFLGGVMTESAFAQCQPCIEGSLAIGDGSTPVNAGTLYLRPPGQPSGIGEAHPGHPWGPGTLCPNHEAPPMGVRP
jgi:hypothetical protein